jgi:DNA-binding response OmpR family regulator
VNTNVSEPLLNGTLAPDPTPAAFGHRALQLPNAIADFERSEIRHADGNCFGLSVRESELLQFLASHPGRPVSRDEILRCVWHLNPRNLITRTIDMHIAHLRDKLQEDPEHPKVLVTVRGEGYMFAAGT